jgi:hypothetical protein
MLRHRLDAPKLEAVSEGFRPTLAQAASTVRNTVHGADRGGLGDDGWAEVPEDLVGDPDDTNVPPEFYEPASETKPDEPD